MNSVTSSGMSKRSGWLIACEFASQKLPHDYVAVRFPEALLKTSLIVEPIVAMPAMAESATKTSKSAYSVRSWPCSSSHSLLRIRTIGVLPRFVKHRNVRKSQNWHLWPVDLNYEPIGQKLPSRLGCSQVSGSI